MSEWNESHNPYLGIPNPRPTFGERLTTRLRHGASAVMHFASDVIHPTEPAMAGTHTVETSLVDVSMAADVVPAPVQRVDIAA